MNYKRVYESFIDSRRDKTYSAGAYTELHHVIPRSLGGSDDNENVVRLSFREHVFAHELLARIHEGTPYSRMMWGALIAMMRDATYGKGMLLRKGRGVSRRRILNSLANAKEHHAKSSKGDGSSTADLAVYAFKNDDGRIFKGTRISFMEYANVSAGSLKGLMSGRTKKTKCGWCVPELAIKGSASDEAAQRHRSRTSGKVYSLINLMGESRGMTKHQLHVATGMPYDVIDRITDGGEALCGWARL